MSLPTHPVGLGFTSCIDTSDKPRFKRRVGWDGSFKTNSIALIANNGGTGCVLVWHGESIFWEFEGEGSPDLDFHGLDDAPDGLSIWVGYMRTDPGGFEDPVGDSYLEGTFRDLTPEEWVRLAATGEPWLLEGEDDAYGTFGAVCGDNGCTGPKGHPGSIEAIMAAEAELLGEPRGPK